MNLLVDNSRPRVLLHKLLLVVLLAGCLTGCARQDKDITTIRYMAWGNPEQLATEQKIIEEFEKQHPDIRVKLFMVPTSTCHQKAQIMLASRTAPDVMRVDHYYFPALVRKGYFLCIEPFIEAENYDLDDFFPQALDECRYEGKLHGMNVLFGGMIIYYNKTLFQEAGIPDPYELEQRGEWTYDRYLEVSKILTKQDGQGRYIQFGTLQTSDFAAIWAFGGDILSADYKRCLLDSPEAIRAFQFMKDLRWKHHVSFALTATPPVLL